MKNLILLLAISVLCSCSNDPQIKGVIYDTGLHIYLKSSTGDNLLNTANYNSDNFKIYKEIYGQVVEANNPMSDYPRGFSIINDDNHKCIALGLNDSKTELLPITYVKWNETETDTIRASFLRTDISVICNGVWINGKLVWDKDTPNSSDLLPRSIIIVK